MAKSPQQLDREIAATYVGKLVRFSVPSLGSKPTRVIAGTVQRVMPSGALEIRAQLGGYHIVPVGKLES